jgi:hypothetical protein
MNRRKGRGKNQGGGGWGRGGKRDMLPAREALVFT